MWFYAFVDCLCWGGHELHDCTAEFRLFWKQSKMSEVPQLSTPLDAPAFVSLPVLIPTPEGLHKAYNDNLPFIRDGLLFMHKEACYHGGQTPLALVWKDSQTSRYSIDTDASGIPLDKQYVTLIYSGNEQRDMVTGDDWPMAVASLPRDFTIKMAAHLERGKNLKFILPEDGVHELDNGNFWLNLVFVGAVNQRRKKADMISKILFQHMLRTQPLQFAHLLEASSSSVREMELENTTGVDCSGSIQAG